MNTELKALIAVAIGMILGYVVFWVFILPGMLEDAYP